MEFQINSIQELEQLSEKVTWQYFEKLVAYVFEENGFEAEQNKVIVFNNDRRQFDVIARKNGETYLIECKRWKSRADSMSALKRAVETHLERCSFYSEATGEKAIPLLVSPLKGMPEQHEDVFIVPLLSLNWFLNNQ
ncbi:restriction endonuclease [Candidatus Woesearchaeota archaeon]|nr:restriction endonuclease [Candidatus Woesearchaeota archaeon]